MGQQGGFGDHRSFLAKWLTDALTLDIFYLKAFESKCARLSRNALMYINPPGIGVLLYPFLSVLISTRFYVSETNSPHHWPWSHRGLSSVRYIPL
jgi:hypothetical protein